MSPVGPEGRENGMFHESIHHRWVERILFAYVLLIITSDAVAFVVDLVYDIRFLLSCYR